MNRSTLLLIFGRYCLVFWCVMPRALSDGPRGRGERVGLVVGPVVGRRPLPGDAAISEEGVGVVLGPGRSLLLLFSPHLGMR